MAENGENNPQLEDVLIAFQKSLARVRQSTTAVSKYDAEFATGNRALYLVDSLQIELKAGLSMDMKSEEAGDEVIKVDFGAATDRQSVIKFTVEPTVLEAPEDNMLLLAPSPTVPGEYKVNLIYPGAEVAEQPVILQFTHTGQKGSQQDIQVKTDKLGRIKFLIEAQGKQIRLEGQSDPIPLVREEDGDWYVQALFKEDNIELVSDIKKIRHG